MPLTSFASKVENNLNSCFFGLNVNNNCIIDKVQSIHQIFVLFKATTTTTLFSYQQWEQCYLNFILTVVLNITVHVLYVLYVSIQRHEEFETVYRNVTSNSKTTQVLFYTPFFGNNSFWMSKAKKCNVRNSLLLWFSTNFGPKISILVLTAALNTFYICQTKLIIIIGIYPLKSSTLLKCFSIDT